ncbi:hypothetical protein ACFX13_041524 [Malus domestica]
MTGRSWVELKKDWTVFLLRLLAGDLDQDPEFPSVDEIWNHIDGFIKNLFTLVGLRAFDAIFADLTSIVSDVINCELLQPFTLEDIKVAVHKLGGLKVFVPNGFHCILLGSSYPTLSHLFFGDDSLFFINADPDNCRALRDILDIYCIALGQAINQQKSSIGWSKNEALGFVKDRIIQTIQSWKHASISLSGRECDQKDKENKIHWRNWTAVSTSKSSGGLGFRSLHDFNVALLSKQYWQIINNPTAFWARILCGRYFPRGLGVVCFTFMKLSYLFHDANIDRDRFYSLVAFFCWEIWKARCQASFNGIISSSAITIHKACSGMEEFWSADPIMPSRASPAMAASTT